MAAAKKLAGYTVVNGTTYGPGDKLPADVAEQITNPKLWDGEAPAESDDGSGEEKPYDKRKKAELEAEVAARNEGREDDDQIVVEGKGTVASLAAALTADDEAQASKDA